MLTRRQALKSLATIPLIHGCTTTNLPTTRNYSPSGIPLRRVRVSRSRIIRSIAGLRPFRSSGFVVNAERMNDKVIIHNYGHGGGGITLSWGTLTLPWSLQMKLLLNVVQFLVAAQRVCLQQDNANCWMGRHHLRKGFTSQYNVKCRWRSWSPTSVFEEQFATPKFLQQFESAMRHAYRYYQDLVGSEYGVRWISNYNLANDVANPNSLYSKYASMYPQQRLLEPTEHPFNAGTITHFDTMLVEPAVYLPKLMSDVQIAGGKINVRNFHGLSEILSLAEPVIINCTGLGSRELFGDEDLIPIRGQLTFLLPQEEVQYIIVGNEGLYMFPRSDGILLGGTFERNQWDIQPDPQITDRLINGHKAFSARCKTLGLRKSPRSHDIEP